MPKPMTRAPTSTGETPQIRARRAAATTKGSADTQSRTMPAAMRARPSQSTAKAYRAGEPRCTRPAVPGAYSKPLAMTGAGTQAAAWRTNPSTSYFSMLPEDHQSSDHPLAAAGEHPTSTDEQTSHQPSKPAGIGKLVFHRFERGLEHFHFLRFYPAQPCISAQCLLAFS